APAAAGRVRGHAAAVRAFRRGRYALPGPAAGARAPDPDGRGHPRAAHGLEPPAAARRGSAARRLRRRRTRLLRAQLRGAGDARLHRCQRPRRGARRRGPPRQRHGRAVPSRAFGRGRRATPAQLPDDGPRMSSFTLYPAIDVRHGRIVRLAQGDYAQETRYGDDPLALARAYAEQGARWLHLVDLDAARAGGYTLSALVGDIATQTGLQVQTG